MKNVSTRIGRDFYAGLVISAFFALVLFVLIPAYVKAPSFIPRFAPPPDMWPRTIAILGLAMGLLVLVRAISKARLKMAEKTVNTRLLHGLRFVQVATGFGVFVWLMPTIGFLTDSIAFLAFLFAMTGCVDQRRWMCGLSVAFPLILYVIFSEIAHIPFPSGTLFSLANTPLSMRASTNHGT